MLGCNKNYLLYRLHFGAKNNDRSMTFNNSTFVCRFLTILCIVKLQLIWLKYMAAF